MKRLNDNYDISVEKMLDIEKGVGAFFPKESEFYDSKMNPVKKNVLTNDNKQIFSMKDGKFVLEVESEGECYYFYSEDINDLI